MESIVALVLAFAFGVVSGVVTTAWTPWCDLPEDRTKPKEAVRRPAARKTRPKRKRS